MERLGFGYGDLSRINPRIVYALGTGFGLDGPYVHKGGQDILAQAMSGAMHRRADPALPLSIYPTALADYAAGMHLVQGILLALMQREKTGEGQRVAVSLYNSMLAMQMQEAAMWMMRGRGLNWAAMPLSGVFETTDGAVVMVGAFKENPLRDICRALGLDDLSADPRYAGLETAEGASAGLQKIFRDRFAGNTTAYWLERARRRRPPVRAGEDPGGGPGRSAEPPATGWSSIWTPARRAGAPRGLAHRAVGGSPSRCIARRRGWVSTTAKCWRRCRRAGMTMTCRCRCGWGTHNDDASAPVQAGGRDSEVPAQAGGRNKDVPMSDATGWGRNDEVSVSAQADGQGDETPARAPAGGTAA